MSLRKASNTASEKRSFLQKPLLGVCTILIALLITGAAGCKASASHKNTSSGATLTVKEVASSAYRFVSGESMVYQLDYASESLSDFSALFKGQQSPSAKERATSSLDHAFRVVVRGELVAKVIEKNTGGFTIAYGLRSPTVRLNADGQEAANEAQTVQTDLSKDVFAAINPQGRVLAVRFDPVTSKLSQSFARTLLASTQFVLPVEQISDLHQWETQEDDPNGQYTARYQAEHDSSNGAPGNPQANLLRIRKTKVSYLQPDRNIKPGEFDVATTISPQGSLVARFDLSEGHLVSLSGSESQITVVAGKKVARSETTLRLNFLGKEILKPAELSLLRAASAEREKVAAAVPLSAKPSKEEREAFIQRTELGDATLEGLLADLAKAEGSTDKPNDDTPLYLKFKALVYLHPEYCATLAKILSTADPNSLTMRVLAGALGAVGRPEAQAALATAIKSRSADWRALSSLIPTLGMVESPTQLAEDTLLDLASSSPIPDIASTAQLSLGIMARNLTGTSPERAAKIVDLFIGKIGASPSQDTTRQLLLALGNAGSARALPTITQFITDPSAAVRSAAVLALRFIDSSQADDLLIKALTSDPEDTVRLEAATALKFREMNADTFEAQKRVFLTDNAVSVRLAVLNNLWQAHEKFPEAYKLVKRAAVKDVSKDVHQAAANIIAKSPKSN